MNWCAAFISKYFANILAEQINNPALYTAFAQAGEAIGQHYESLGFAHAMREIMLLADRANQYIDAEKPCQAIKDPAQNI
jgi:methionyl-tRNA synthetase